MDMRALIFLLGVGLVSPAWAGSLTFEWTAPTTFTDGSSLPTGALAGYTLGYGTSSGNYTSSAVLGDVTTYTLSGLDGSTRYYIAVKARAGTGYEDSGWSNEVDSLGDIVAPVGTAFPVSPTPYVVPLTWGVTTDEAATCRYGSTEGIAFDAMTLTFATTGGTTHSESLGSPREGGIYKYVARCRDPYGNTNTSDIPIRFVVQPRPKRGAPGK